MHVHSQVMTCLNESSYISEYLSLCLLSFRGGDFKIYDILYNSGINIIVN